MSLGSLFVLLDLLKLLWASEGCFEVILPHFQKTFIFLMDFNVFIILWGQLGTTWGHLGLPRASFGSRCGYFGYMRVALGDLWVILGSPWIYVTYMCDLEGPFSIWC